MCNISHLIGKNSTGAATSLTAGCKELHRNGQLMQLSQVKLSKKHLGLEEEPKILLNNIGTTISFLQEYDAAPQLNREEKKSSSRRCSQQLMIIALVNDNSK